MKTSKLRWLGLLAVSALLTTTAQSAAGVPLPGPTDAAVYGVVTTEAGDPVVAKTVQLVSASGTTTRSTNGFGYYEFAAVPPGPATLQFAGSGDFLPVISDSLTLIAGQATEFNQVLPRGATIGGTISNEDGSAIEPLQIVVRSDTVVRSTVVNAGQTSRPFALAGLPAGVYDLEISSRLPVANSRFPTKVVEDVAVDLDTDAADLNIVLELFPTVSGTVYFESPTGPQPLAGANVQLWQGTSVYGPGAQTAADGTYRIEKVPVGTWEVAISSSYGGSTWWDGETTQATADDLVVEYGVDRTGIDAVLSVFGRLRGTVVDQDFGALQYAQVTVFRVDPDTGRLSIEKSMLTDNTGAWSTFVEPGVFIVRVRHQGISATAYYDGSPTSFGATEYEVSDAATVDVGGLMLSNTHLIGTARVAGPDRFSTNVAISQFAFPEDDPDVPVVYVASGMNYPDALTAGPAAIAQGGALLLVYPNQIPSVVADELDRLNPARIVVVGSTASVSASTFAELMTYVDDPNDIIRLGGTDRYATAILVVRHAFEGSEITGAYIATGTNFPDALAAGPAAGYEGLPVILVDGNAPSLDPRVADLLADLGPYNLFIAGGPPSVSMTMEHDLRQAAESYLGYDPGAQRFAGTSRFHTAALINQYAFGFEGSELAFIATGMGFADALSSASAAGRYGAPLYLSQPNCIPVDTAQSILYVDVNTLFLLGSDSTLSSDVEHLTICP